MNHFFGYSYLTLSNHKLRREPVRLISKYLPTVLLSGAVAMGSVSVSYQANSQTLQKRQSIIRGTGPTNGGGPAVPRPSYQIPFHANCAAGFSKAGQNMYPNKDIDWYVCSTPIITCPKFMQPNGLYSYVKAKVILQPVGGDPDAPTTSFRVQYKCDYSFRAVPVP